MCCLSATQPRSLRFVNFKTWVSKLSLKNLLILSHGWNILEYHYKCNIYTVKTKIQNTCKRPSSDLAIVIHRVFESWVVIAFSSSSTVPGIELIVIVGHNHDFMEFIVTISWSSNCKMLSFATDFKWYPWSPYQPPDRKCTPGSTIGWRNNL